MGAGIESPKPGDSSRSFRVHSRPAVADKKSLPAEPALALPSRAPKYLTTVNLAVKQLSGAAARPEATLVRPATQAAPQAVWQLATSRMATMAIRSVALEPKPKPKVSKTPLGEIGFI